MKNGNSTQDKKMSLSNELESPDERVDSGNSESDTPAQKSDVEGDSILKSGKRISSQTKKKRRLIDDDDDDESDAVANRLGNSNLSVANDSAKSTEENTDGSASTMTTRRSSSRNTPSLPAMPKSMSSTASKQKRKLPPNRSSTDKEPQVSTIPKKKVPRKGDSADAATAPQKSSLLAQMAQPPVATKSQSSSASSTKPPIRNKQNAPKAFPARAAAIKLEAPSPIPEISKERKLKNFLDSQAKPDVLSSSSSSVPTPMGRNIKWNESVVIKDLHDMCVRCSREDGFRLPLASASSKVDFSGSFLDTDQYDFFDTNARGEILLPHKPPIFPEEFPSRMKEHPLSWWGILDESRGRGKFGDGQHHVRQQQRQQASISATQPFGKNAAQRQRNDAIYHGERAIHSSHSRTKEERDGWRGPPQPDHSYSRDRRMGPPPHQGRQHDRHRAQR